MEWEKYFDTAKRIHEQLSVEQKKYPSKEYASNEANCLLKAVQNMVMRHQKCWTMKRKSPSDLFVLYLSLSDARTLIAQGKDNLMKFGFWVSSEIGDQIKREYNYNPPVSAVKNGKESHFYCFVVKIVYNAGDSPTCEHDDMMVQFGWLVREKHMNESLGLSARPFTKEEWSTLLKILELPSEFVTILFKMGADKLDPYSAEKVLFKTVECMDGSTEKKTQISLALGEIREKRMDTCANCDLRFRRLSKCGRCKKTRYCTKECQLEHWAEHKKVCK